MNSKLHTINQRVDDEAAVLLNQVVDVPKNATHDGDVEVFVAKVQAIRMPIVNARDLLSSLLAKRVMVMMLERRTGFTEEGGR